MRMLYVAVAPQAPFTKKYIVLKYNCSMKKSKIYATGNETLKGEFNISYYILEKDDKFFDWLALLLKDVLEIEYPVSAKFWIINNEDGSEELIPKDIN